MVVVIFQSQFGRVFRYSCLLPSKVIIHACVSVYYCIWKSTSQKLLSSERFSYSSGPGKWTFTTINVWLGFSVKDFLHLMLETMHHIHLMNQHEPSARIKLTIVTIIKWIILSPINYKKIIARENCQLRLAVWKVSKSLPFVSFYFVKQSPLCGSLLRKGVFLHLTPVKMHLGKKSLVFSPSPSYYEDVYYGLRRNYEA